MRNRVIGFIILALLGLTISKCSSADRNEAGEITKSGDVNAFEIKTGDCFTELPSADGETFSSIKAVPCNEAHHWQAFHNGTLAFSFFSEDEVSQVSSVECNKAADKLINQMSSIKLDAFKNAELVSFYPTSESWTSNNDRALDCLIGSDSDTYFTSVFN